MPSAVKSGGTLNSLYLDNFQLRYVDDEKNGEPEEYCVIPDRDDQLYRRGDTVRFAVRARLADAADSLDAELAVLRDYNNSELAALPLRLTRRADGTWTGSASWKAGEYGSFTTVLRRKGKPLRGINTSVQVLHPAVTHPFGSYGKAPALIRPWGKVSVYQFRATHLKFYCSKKRTQRFCIGRVLGSCNSWQ